MNRYTIARVALDALIDDEPGFARLPRAHQAHFRAVRDLANTYATKEDQT
jgi:hypothetical protein